MFEDRDWIKWKKDIISEYDQINYRAVLQSWIMKQGHKKLEEKIPNKHYSSILEVGAGTGEHFKYIKNQPNSYLMVDTNKAFLELAKKKYKNYKNLKFHYLQSNNLDLKNVKFDRVIAANVLEHIYYPHLAIKEWINLTRTGGLVSVLIPTDPGLLWNIGQMIGPRRKAIQRGIPYDYIMAREHVNSCKNLVALLNYYLPNSEGYWWPFIFPCIGLNLFYIFHGVVK